MLPRLSITNESGSALPAGLARRASALARAASRAARRDYCDVSLVFVREARMRALNRTYRHHDRVTDVLSFTYQARPVVGEIVICSAQARRQALRHAHSLAHELEILIVHGLLHIAGHDHVRAPDRLRMHGLERRVIQSAGKALR
jgi:probable rRNA maturation factor